MLSKRDIVCFSTEDWDPPLPTNKHQLMVRLARYGNRVFYIETIGIRKPGFQRPDIKRIIKRVKKVVPAPRERIKNLVVISPGVFPAGAKGVPLKINKTLFLPRLKRTIKRWNVHDPIVWVFNPYAVHFIDSLPKGLLIYHCVDDLGSVPGVDRHALHEAEKALLRKADLVFATTDSLLRKCRQYNEKCYLQTNVGDFAHFNRADKGDTPVAEAVAKLKHPVVMFAGNLAASKVDFDLVQQYATKRIDTSVVLIGPVWKDVSPLRLENLQKLSNLYMLPHVPYTRLPSYLKAADVLIIPYHINEYTRGVFPLKFFEFLATGKPVVSIGLPALERYSDIVPVPKTQQGFMREVDMAVKEEDTRKQQRLELARRNTWETRLEEISSLIREATG